MTEKEIKLQTLIAGRNALITAILALQNNYNVDQLQDLRDEVNGTIKELKMIEE